MILQQTIFYFIAVPGPPQNVRILGNTTTQLKVGWDPPGETNGQLKGYYVYNGTYSNYIALLLKIVEPFRRLKVHNSSDL